MIHKTHVLLKQYGERGIILTKRNLSLSMNLLDLLEHHSLLYSTNPSVAAEEEFHYSFFSIVLFHLPIVLYHRAKGSLNRFERLPLHFQLELIKIKKKYSMLAFTIDFYNDRTVKLKKSHMNESVNCCAK